MSHTLHVTADNIVELKAAVGKMKLPDMVALWNQYEKPIKKFESKEQGIFNVRALYDTLLHNPHHKYVAPPEEAVTAEPAKKGRKGSTDEEKAAKKAAEIQRKADLKAEKAQENAARKAAKIAEKEARKAAKASPSFRYEPNPNKAPHAVRAGSMVSKMIDLISRPEGATIEELEAVSFDTSHSVKSLLGYDMRNQVGYGYYSEDGKTVHILYPEGMTAPLAHAVKPEPKPKEVKPPKEPKAAKTKKGEVVSEPVAEAQA